MRYICVILTLLLSASCIDNNDSQKRSQKIIREVIKRIVTISGLDSMGNSLIIRNKPISNIIRGGLNSYVKGREKDSLVTYFIPKYLSDYREDLNINFLKKERLFNSVNLFINPDSISSKENIKASIAIPYIYETNNHIFLSVNVEGYRNCPTIGYFLVYNKLKNNDVYLNRAQLIYSSDLKTSLKNLF